MNRYSFGILDSEEMVKKYAKSADQKVVALIQTDTVSFKQRKYDIYLVDDQEIHLPQEVYFSSLNESAMYIIYPGKGPTGNGYE